MVYFSCLLHACVLVVGVLVWSVVFLMCVCVCVSALFMLAFIDVMCVTYCNLSVCVVS